MPASASPPGEWGARQLSAPAPEAPRLVLGWEISGCRSRCSPSVGLERAPKNRLGAPGHRGVSSQGAASSGRCLVAAGTWAPSRGGGRLFSGSTGAQLSCTEKQASAEGQLDQLKLIAPGMISASWGNYRMQPGAHWSPGVFSWLLSTTPPRQSHFCLLAFATDGGCPPRAVLCTDRPGSLQSCRAKPKPSGSPLLPASARIISSPRGTFSYLSFGRTWLGQWEPTCTNPE